MFTPAESVKYQSSDIRAFLPDTSSEPLLLPSQCTGCKEGFLTFVSDLQASDFDLGLVWYETNIWAIIVSTLFYSPFSRVYIMYLL